MAVEAIGGLSVSKNQPTQVNSLGLDDFLKILLTQLTYQDPLKPMDNFQFVSQLAQFSQIQIGQTTNDKLESLVTAQSNIQATGLLGRTVDIGTGTSLISGKVTSLAFDNGNSSITIKTANGSTISGISISGITQIREGN